MSKLITGGLGFIGANLAKELVKRGERVVLFDTVRYSELIEDVKDDVQTVCGDLSNWAQVLDTVKRYRVDYVYHAGALLSASAEENPQAAYAVNANGTLNVLEAARLFGVGGVIFLSSMATFGFGLPERVTDDMAQRPTTMYGVTKVFGERLGEYYYSKFGVNFRGVRLPSIIGPGRRGGGVSAYSSLIIEEPAYNKPYKVFIDEETRIPLLYIKDAVRALIELEKARDEKLRRRVYNVEGFSPTAIQLAEAVKRRLPDAQIEFCPDPQMVQIARSWPRELDGSCARADWGWKIQYTLESTVEDFIDECRAINTLI